MDEYDDDADLIEQQISDDGDDDNATWMKMVVEEDEMGAVNAIDDDELALEVYEQTEMLGQGAYGIVYKGRKLETDDIVAIQRIPFTDSTPKGGVPALQLDSGN